MDWLARSTAEISPRRRALATSRPLRPTRASSAAYAPAPPAPHLRGIRVRGRRSPSPVCVSPFLLQAIAAIARHPVESLADAPFPDLLRSLGQRALPPADMASAPTGCSSRAPVGPRKISAPQYGHLMRPLPANTSSPPQLGQVVLASSCA